MSLLTLWAVLLPPPWWFWPSQTAFDLLIPLGLKQTKSLPRHPVWGEPDLFFLTTPYSLSPHPMLPTSNHNSDSVLVCLVLCVNEMWKWSSLASWLPSPSPCSQPLMKAGPVRDLQLKKKQNKNPIKRLINKEKKTETLTNGIESKTWILIHTRMDTWFLTKKLKLYNGKKKASSTNGVGITGCQHVEQCK